MCSTSKKEGWIYRDNMMILRRFERNSGHSSQQILNVSLWKHQILNFQGQKIETITNQSQGIESELRASLNFEGIVLDLQFAQMVNCFAVNTCSLTKSSESVVKLIQKQPSRAGTVHSYGRFILFYRMLEVMGAKFMVHCAIFRITSRQRSCVHSAKAHGRMKLGLPHQSIGDHQTNVRGQTILLMPETMTRPLSLHISEVALYC